MKHKTTQKAVQIAVEAHKRQYRRNGEPYSFHLFRVASNKKYITSETLATIAILHDILEDTKTTSKNLLEYGFSTEIIETVELLTHEIDDDYEKYIEEIATNQLAIRVKLADLTDNLDPSGLSSISEKDKNRMVKYLKAKDYLEKHLK